MKKAILTFALFSLVVLTSFTTTETQTQNLTQTGDTGGGTSTGAPDRIGAGQAGGTSRKLDYTATTVDKNVLNFKIESSK